MVQKLTKTGGKKGEIMKIDILDTAMNSNGMSYFDLTERIETLEKAGAQIKDIKHIS